VSGVRGALEDRRLVVAFSTSDEAHVDARARDGGPLVPRGPAPRCWQIDPAPGRRDRWGARTRGSTTGKRGRALGRGRGRASACGEEQQRAKQHGATCPRRAGAPPPRCQLRAADRFHINLIGIFVPPMNTDRAAHAGSAPDPGTGPATWSCVRSRPPPPLTRRLRITTHARPLRLGLELPGRAQGVHEGRWGREGPRPSCGSGQSGTSGRFSTVGRSGCRAPWPPRLGRN